MKQLENKQTPIRDVIGLIFLMTLFVLGISLPFVIIIGAVFLGIKWVF